MFTYSVNLTLRDTEDYKHLLKTTKVLNAYIETRIAITKSNQTGHYVLPRQGYKFQNSTCRK